MHHQFRPRRLARAALTVALAAFPLVIAACTQYPNSVFHPRTDTNRDIGFLFEILIWFGSIVFVVVEAILVYTLIRFRRRGGTTRQPEHVHGNTTLEITWTIVPALILVFIAIPTVRTIFRTQARRAKRCAAGRGNRAPVVVGVSLSAIHLRGAQPESSTPSSRRTSSTCRRAAP